MKEDLITFEIAKLAKEKEFTGLFPTTDYIPMYVDKGNNRGDLTEQQGEDDSRGDFYLAPTQSLLNKWLREKHNIIVVVKPIDEKEGENWKRIGFGAIIYKYNKEDIIIDHTTKPHFEAVQFYDSYEEALEIGLQEALKLIKIE